MPQHLATFSSMITARDGSLCGHRWPATGMQRGHDLATGTTPKDNLATLFPQLPGRGHPPLCPPAVIVCGFLIPVFASWGFPKGLDGITTEPGRPVNQEGLWDSGQCQLQGLASPTQLIRSPPTAPLSLTRRWRGTFRPVSLALRLEKERSRTGRKSSPVAPFHVDLPFQTPPQCGQLGETLWQWPAETPDAWCYPASCLQPSRPLGAWRWWVWAWRCASGKDHKEFEQRQPRGSIHLASSELCFLQSCA